MREIKHIDVKYKGCDDWGRPVFKDVNTCIHYGSVDILGYGKTEQEIIEFFRKNPGTLCYFGSTFNCEPNGGMPEHYRLNIID